MTIRPRNTRPRYGRLTAAGSAVTVTLIAVLGGLGALPAGTSDASAAGASSTPQARLASETLPTLVGSAMPTPPPSSAPTPTRAPPPSPPTTGPTTGPTLPSGSGKGKRVVFDMSAQRIWLVEEQNEVLRSYLVSGSLTDNLSPGTYAVFSKSRQAVGIDDSGEMEYFVRFTRGDNAAIGFHSIPTKDGRPLQTAAQLGTPQSHGCIRQARADAQRLWSFAPVGSKVVVTA